MRSRSTQTPIAPVKAGGKKSRKTTNELMKTQIPSVGQPLPEGWSVLSEFRVLPCPPTSAKKKIAKSDERTVENADSPE